ncbi:MAG: hypothetical protein J6M64_08470 [Oscillospiraceae bacterium]|nr:hypothetical protein [Clostridia bacterium]MBP3209921.1 hypothetical protein [Oscillospiraceae bacterium]
MENEHRISKIFSAPEGLDCDAIFCVFENPHAFLGYIIVENKPCHGIKIYIGKKIPKNQRYINCDHLYEFPKNIYYTELTTRYDLRELRRVTGIFRKGIVNRNIINGDCFVSMNSKPITPVQRQNRKNPEYHKKLKESIALREKAVIQNDKKAVAELTRIIDELNNKLGYYDTNTPGKYKIGMKDTVTNTKPLQGGTCTPK